MAKDPTSGLKVIISYKQLEELLEASALVPELRKEIVRLEQQITALRMIQSECMEAIGDIKHLL